MNKTDEMLREKALRETLAGIAPDDETRSRMLDGICAHRRNKKIVPLMVAAAAFVIISVFGVMIYSENNQYQMAMAFFEDYELSAEDLTRGDIKNIYKDISTGRFEMDKTYDVIRRSVGGQELFQEEPSREDMQILWDYRNLNFINMPQNHMDEDGVCYSSKLLDNDNYETIFKKYKNGQEIWSTRIEDFFHTGHIMIRDEILVYGYTSYIDMATQVFAKAVMLDEDGNEKWTYLSTGEYLNEQFVSAVNGPEGIMLFGRGGWEYITSTKIDTEGNLIAYNSFESDGFGFIKAASRIGEGYLVLFHSNDSGDKIIRTDKNGMPSDSFVYESDEEMYFITDMAEFSGSIFVSAYAVQKDEDTSSCGGRYEICSVLQYIFEEEHIDIPNDELTELLRENFTAVLMECDTYSGVPQEFYSVKGSFGGDLNTQDDELVWKVESITDSFFSIATSSFTISANCIVHKYTFDENRNLIDQKKTSEVTNYRR